MDDERRFKLARKLQPRLSRGLRRARRDATFTYTRSSTSVWQQPNRDAQSEQHYAAGHTVGSNKPGGREPRMREDIFRAARRHVRWLAEKDGL